MMPDSNTLPTDSDLEFYRENGYWLGPKILSDEELEALRVHQATVIAGQYETGRRACNGNTAESTQEMRVSVGTNLAKVFASPRKIGY